MDNQTIQNYSTDAKNRLVGRGRESSTPIRQPDVLISFSSGRGHRSSQSTTHSWDVPKCAKDYSKTREGWGRL